MKNVKRLGLGLSLGLALAFSTVGFANSTTQTDQTRKDSCCSMSCCKDGSCSMMDHKKEGQTAEHSTKAGCCGDSCNMKSHEGMKNHAAMEGCCCKGDSCSMGHEMKDDKAHQTMDHSRMDPAMDHTKMDPAMHKAMHGDKGGCCCCGDSCDMKMSKEKAKT